MRFIYEFIDFINIAKRWDQSAIMGGYLWIDWPQ